MVFSGLMVVLRKVPTQILVFLNRRFAASLEIMGDDTSFQWLQTWLAAREWGQHRKHITATVPNKRDSKRERNGKRKVIYVPAPGNYLSIHKKWPILIRVVREDIKQGNLSIGYRHRTTVATILRGREFLESVVNEAHDVYQQMHNEEVEIHYPRWGSWRIAQRTPPRPFDSIFLDGDMKERLVADIQKFLSSSDWYHDKGIPWKRGYLLHGGPGNGKTSLVKAIAGRFQFNIYVLNLSTVANDQYLVEMITDVPVGSILLIEDLDSVFKGREDVNKKGKDSDEERNGITFNGLLNAIDGITSQEGVILFITTNMRNRIDPLLLRPGRIDLGIEISDATVGQVESLVRHIYGNQVDGRARELGKLLGDRGVSMAEVQNHLMRYVDSPSKAVQHALKIVKSRK